MKLAEEGQQHQRDQRDEDREDITGGKVAALSGQCKVPVMGDTT